MPVNQSSYALTPEALHMTAGAGGAGGARDAILPGDVLTRLTRQRPNILLVGPTAFAQAALKSVESSVPHPIVSWAPDQTRTVPGGAYATLVIHRVDTADAEQQQQLCKWFDARPRHVQVVSTTQLPLYSLVEQGTFLETLYYRLNHVCLISENLDSAQ